MTVTNIARGGDHSFELDRTPPHDIAAEQSVLGGMLLSKDAIADVVELVRAADFYRPAHSIVFEVIGDLYGRGEPADVISVAAELGRRDLLERVGGPAYLHTLISSVPTAANAGYYARIVAEKAILRRLAEAGTRIVQLAYGPAADVDELVDRAQAAVYEVTERRANEDYAPLSDLLNPALEEIEAIAGHDGALTGVPTGFTDLDELTNGLHPGQLWIVAARPAVGKALALDTPLPTPTGWTTMGDVAVGDLLLGTDGEPTRVVAATEVLLDRPCYEVEFSDGTVLVADARHQWPAEPAAAARRARSGSRLATLSRPITTERLAGTLYAPGGGPAHALVLAPGAARLRWDGRQVAETRLVTDVRPVRSVPVRCVEVDSPDHCYLAGPTCVPTHNSTLGLDFARSASIKHGMTSVIFSLEMSRMEITMRLLSAEARVSLQNIRTGRLTDDDWARLARRMGEVAEAPLFIDDSPHLTMMEIRAKARRLRQRNDLRLIIVDYLQLMSSPKRVENRQQEVSEISRSLKLLAKELEIPVVAISQLNRASEQRADKRPQVSDLRESGCVTGDTRLLRADTGAEVTIAELVATGERDVPVWSVDERLRMVPARLTHAFPSGTKDVFELVLRSGRVVKASANHPFLTLDGWRRLDELTPGTPIAQSLIHN
ncbi:MAG: replicative DNA helicase [Frankia sp.]|nr:replicative DNA helicase [Frankia sp.]